MNQFILMKKRAAITCFWMLMNRWKIYPITNINGFGKKNYPTLNETLEILEKIKAAEMTIEELFDNLYEIDISIVSKYEKIFGIKLSIEIQKIVSYKKGLLLYNGNDYRIMSPKEWTDILGIFGFDFKESGLIPLLWFDVVICYDPKEKAYLFKDLSLGFESDYYDTLIQLLDNQDSIIKR